jgi:ubiquitin thioesterase protein OTUB1
MQQDQQDLDRQTEVRLQEIESKVKEQPLTSECVPIASLQTEYKDSSTHFTKGISALEQTYDCMRTIRGDGNCYYRAFLYSLATHILTNPLNGPVLLKTIKEDSWKQVLAAGYDEFMLEAFYDAVVDLLERVIQGKLTQESLHAELNEETGTSDYATWYLRVVAATHLKTDPDRFLPFMEGMNVDTFCKTEVEPMGKECGQVQILAIAEALAIEVVIEYLDGHDAQGQVTKHTFGPDSASIRLHFLYRPGHYDILYAKKNHA